MPQQREQASPRTEMILRILGVLDLSLLWLPFFAYFFGKSKKEEGL
jgi:hypothetical protein